MSRQPRFSIVLPVYNGETYLAEAIRSVLNQNLTDFELLISDDGSKDSSARIIQSYSDERIRLIPRGTDPTGLFHNLNRLVKSARAPFIHILCQDDILLPDCLQSEEAFFLSHPAVGMTYCGINFLDRDSKTTRSSGIRDLPEVIQPRLALQHFYYHGCLPSNLSSVAVRKSSFEKTGFFDPSFTVSGDYELWARICESFPLGIIPQYLVGVRLHEKQLSKANSSVIPFILQNRCIRNHIFPLLPEENKLHAYLFEIFFHSVNDFHPVYAAIRAKRFSHALEILSTLGLLNILVGPPLWLLTLNNRRFRIMPRFALTEQEIAEHTELYRLKEQVG